MTLQPDPLAVQPLNNQPPPQKSSAWAATVLLLVVPTLLIGAAAVLYSLVANPVPGGAPDALITRDVAYELAALALNLVLLVVCLVGVGLVRNTLLRVGLVLQALVALASVLMNWPAIILASNPHSFPSWLGQLYLSLFFLYTPPGMPLFEVATGLLGLLSLICFSYTLARWQPSDKWLLWVQIVVTLGLGFIVWKTTFPSLATADWSIVFGETVGPFLAIATCVCILLRPACWKASPLIVLCFTLGTIVLLCYSEAVDHFIRVIGNQMPILEVDRALLLASLTLVLLGLLLLIRRARVHRQ